MALHFPEKFIERLTESFKIGSFTESSMDHSLDASFSGVKTVHLMSIQTEELQNYNRTTDPSKGSRYGDVKEVQDTVETYTMTQDKSLSLSIDKGNNKEQFNLKKAATVMSAEKEEKIIPWLDKYRLEKWAQNAGIHYELSAALTKSNIVSEIIELHNKMLDVGVPETGCTLFIARKYVPAMKLSPEWTGLDSLGGKSLPSGSIGEIDGLSVKPIATSRMPANVAFMILHKSAVFAPIKIQEFKGHMDPPGLSGDLLEFRMITDAFVRGTKANGVAVACEKGTIVATPTFSGTSSITIATETTGATIYYTLDGSDPRYSANKKTYTSAITLANGDALKAYADKDGMFSSAVATK